VAVGASLRDAAMPFDFDRVFASRPVILAPMEDVSDAVFRRICRAHGADVCVTEFVRAENLAASSERELKKIRLTPDDQPTAIQIYGSDPAMLAEAAEIAERAGPAYIDINCGCWVPRIARKGACAIPTRWWRWRAWSRHASRYR
jgi:tRNA-dihydrouridine synthase